MNKLLDLEFLNVDYINFIKDFTFYAFVAFCITIALWVFSEAINRNNDTFASTCRQLIQTIAFIIGFCFTLIVLVLFISALVYPGLLLIANIKDILIAKYLTPIDLLSGRREMFVSITSIVIGSCVYGFIVEKILVKAIKNITYYE